MINQFSLSLSAKAAAGLMILFMISTSSWGGELAGMWQEYDDDTGKLVALIRIEKLPDSTYEGKIEKVISDNGVGKVEPVCGACIGVLHNQPLVGLRILYGMKRKDRLSFAGGVILDPDDGKSYQCRIRLAEDNKTLEVTGYLSLNWIGQSEVWRRAD